uniref:CCHC-type domain-containing protein n=1 Tax=Tanacetum cinerariifolium TaxID=118510 RepID=A0A6L2JVQ6_TANCI|nr:hypothetical protein [Tanacetum cinerariifolium]
MTTLAEHIIVAGAENRPPMLEKSMYDSWASRIRLFIKGKKNAPTHHQHHHTLVNPQQQSFSLQLFISLLVTQQSQAEFPYLDAGLAIPKFQQGEDLIDCINKVMAFLSVVALRILPSNNQLRTGIATTSRENYAAVQAKVVKCYNCLEEEHMAKQCTQPKRTRSFAWFKEKLMLAEA